MLDQLRREWESQFKTTQNTEDEQVLKSVFASKSDKRRKKLL